MIRFIITGGTIDKEYNQLSGKLGFANSHVPTMLEQSRCTFPVVFEQLMLKDSLDMTDHDRETVVKTCFAAAEDKIIITHGTDTMVETARFIAAKITNKTIVLTGAMLPYTISHSDALFNLGCAISAVQVLQHEIYITMNGHIFTWDNVQKRKDQGKFQLLPRT